MPILGCIDYWWVALTTVWYDKIVMYGRPGMFGSVTGGWSHEEDTGG